MCLEIPLSTTVFHSLFVPELSNGFGPVKTLIKETKSGQISWTDAAGKYSACASGPRHGGDLGWQQEEHFHPDFANAVKVIPMDTIGPPIVSPWGVHIVVRTG